MQGGAIRRSHRSCRTWLGSQSRSSPQPPTHHPVNRTSTHSVWAGETHQNATVKPMPPPHDPHRCAHAHRREVVGNGGSEASEVMKWVKAAGEKRQVTPTHAQRHRHPVPYLQVMRGRLRYLSLMTDGPLPGHSHLFFSLFQRQKRTE